MENAAPGAPFIGFGEEETVASRGRVEAVAESGKLGAKTTLLSTSGQFLESPNSGTQSKRRESGLQHVETARNRSSVVVTHCAQKCFKHCARKCTVDLSGSARLTRPEVAIKSVRKCSTVTFHGLFLDILTSICSEILRISSL